MHAETDFKRIFEQAPGRVLVLTPDATIASVSDGFLVATRTAREAVVGLQVTELMPDGLGRTTSYPVLDAEGKVVYVVHRIEDTDATHPDRSAQPVFAQADEPSASERLEYANKELNWLYAEMYEKNRMLEEAARIKSEFLSTMSHELRTPLNAIIGFSELMKDGLVGPVSAEHAEFLGHIFQSGQHLLALINDVLDLSRIDAGKLELEITPLAVEGALADVLSSFEEQARTRSVAMSLSVDPRITEIDADARRFRQIAQNLLSNAMKFTPDRGAISVKATLVDREHAGTALPGFANGARRALPDSNVSELVAITVTDTGIGIAPAHLDSLFIPFSQINRVAAKTVEGTGLGLALVYKLAALHGGTVAVTSAEGEGSAFTVWLPRRRR